jgi:hypothetical protein
MDVLDEAVLVLNRNWQRVGLTSVKDAIGKVFGTDVNGTRAFVIDHDYIQHDWASWMRQPIDGRFIQAPHCKIAAPSIILVARYAEVPAHTVKWGRMRVLKRDRFTCQYCGVQPGVRALTVDHVMPKSRGGGTTWENCVASCEPCNARKADRTPSEAGMKLRKAPGAPFADWDTRAGEKIPEAWKPFMTNAGG